MLKKFIIVGFISLIFSTMLSGQISNSYEQKIKSWKKAENTTLKTLMDSSDYYLDLNRDKSFFYLEKAYVLSLKSNKASQQKVVLRKLGDFYAHFNQASLSAQNYEKSLANGADGDVNFFNIVNKAGHQYLLAQTPEKCMELIDKYYSQSKSTLYQMLMDILKGDAYAQMGRNAEALKAYHLAETKSSILGLTDQNTAIKLKIAKILVSSDSKNALVVLNQAKRQSTTNSNTALQIKSETEIANFYKDNNQPEQEIASRKTIINNLDSNKLQLESLSIDVDETKLGEQVNLATTYNSLKQYDNSIQVLGSSLNSSKNIDGNKSLMAEDSINQKTLELKKEAAKTLSTAYLMTGQKQKALESYKKYMALSEELFKQKELEYKDVNQANRRLRDYQWQIDFLEKDKSLYDSEIEMIKQDRRLQKDKVKFQLWFIIMLSVIIILLAITLIMMRKRSKLQKQHNLMLNLKARRAQMNPHFIFNALNSINSFIAKNDELNANKYLSRFSKLMRSVLDNSESDFIPLSNEIEMLKLYMELEKMRFTEKFDYEIMVAKGLENSNYEIPPMLIQPFVENAVWHGLRYKESGGVLKVSMEKEADFLKVTIEDNGIGRNKSMELKTKNQGLKKSKGIKNTQERLKILSQLYQQEFKSKISDAAENGEGVVVELWIPNQTEKH